MTSSSDVVDEARPPVNPHPTEPPHPSIRVYQRWCDSCPTGVPLLDRLGLAYTEMDLKSDE